MPPGRRRSGGIDRSGSGTRVGSNEGASSVTVTTIADPFGCHLDPAGSATVAVEDHVRRRLVDRLDQVVHARFGASHARDITNELAHVGHAAKLCRDAQRPARAEGHARRTKSAVERLMNRPWPSCP